MNWFTIVFSLLTFVVAGYGAQTTRMTGSVAPRLQRLPIQKSNITLTSPKKYERRVLRYDSKTGEAVYYDPKPQVVLLDAKSGRYALKWIGYDGKEKTVIYQRPDKIDAIVSASVSRTISSGHFGYTYRIDNLPSSGQQLSGFAIQTFSSGVKPLKDHDGFIGQMSNNRTMKEGQWLFFGSSYIGPSIIPGRGVDVRLDSSAPPGLVECSVTGGVFGMKGVGEEMPQELESILPGYEIWPRGLTLGPHHWLQTATVGDKITYIRKILPRMRELGWLTVSASRWYEQNLNSQKLDSVLRRVDEDFKNGNITSEVRDLIKLNLQ